MLFFNARFQDSSTSSPLKIRRVLRRIKASSSSEKQRKISVIQSGKRTTVLKNQKPLRNTMSMVWAKEPVKNMVKNMVSYNTVIPMRKENVSAKYVIFLL